ncbi:acyltransferase [Halobacillus rhizosphaerae]|uniref:acyltransferase n=1 Tax=Halobacillus rhizosphaerae TaxID=3064889 RepID=UPI00398A7781
MGFNELLDSLFGEREVFHILECPVCSFNEIYYADPVTKKTTGRACEQCGSVQVFAYDRSLHV